MQAGVLERAVQAEDRDGDVERLARGEGLHVVLAGHEARWRGERRAGGVFICLAWLQNRLLADHTLAMHVLDPALRIGNLPTAAQKLYGAAPCIDVGIDDGD